MENHAAFYRGYLTDDRSFTPLTVTLATIVALWSLIYLVGCFVPLAKQPTDEIAQWSSVVARPTP